MTLLVLTPALKVALEWGLEKDAPVYPLGRGDCPAELQDMTGYTLETLTDNSIPGMMAAQLTTTLAEALPNMRGVAVLCKAEIRGVPELEPLHKWKGQVQTWFADEQVPTYTPTVNSLVGVLSDWTWVSLFEWPGHRETQKEALAKVAEVWGPIAVGLIFAAVGGLISEIGRDSRRS